MRVCGATRSLWRSHLLGLRSHVLLPRGTGGDAAAVRTARRRAALRAACLRALLERRWRSTNASPMRRNAKQRRLARREREHAWVELPYAPHALWRGGAASGLERLARDYGLERRRRAPVAARRAARAARRAAARCVASAAARRRAGRRWLMLNGSQTARRTPMRATVRRVCAMQTVGQARDRRASSGTVTRCL